MPPKPGYGIGDAVIVVTDDLRVRSKPEVSEDSIKYEPTLRNGTHLEIEAGPVAGSGLWWYRIRLLGGVVLNGGVDRGWVAAGARDGDLWISKGDTTDPIWNVSGWPIVEHDGVRLTGASELAADSTDWRITVQVAGLALVHDGEIERLDAYGSYSIDWVCMEADDSPIGGHITDRRSVSGTAEAAVDVAISRDGTGTGVLVLKGGTGPEVPCPSTSTGWCAWAVHWQGTVIDHARSMALEPPRAGWETIL